MDYIIDSYAWIEYFNGSKKGQIVRKLLQNLENNFLTVAACLSEIYGWALKNNQDFEKLFKIIKTNSNILLISEKDWILSGKERFEQRKTQKDFGLIDAIILVKQKQSNSMIVTGDKHFKNIKNVTYLG